MIEAAYQLFQQKGTDRVTMREIGTKAGVSEASVYRYFGTKSNLLLETYRFLWIEVTGLLYAKTVECKEYRALTGFRQIERLIDALLDVYQGRTEYLRFATSCEFYWIRNQYQVEQEAFDAVVRPILSLFIMAMERGVQDGSIHLEEDAGQWGFSVWAMLRSYMERQALLAAYYPGENWFRVQLPILRKTILKSLQCEAPEAADGLEKESGMVG